MLTYEVKNESLKRSKAKKLSLFDGDIVLALISSEDLKNITDLKEIPEYILKECGSTGHRGRVDCANKYIYGVLNCLEIPNMKLELKELKFFMTANILIIVHDTPNIVLSNLILRLDSGQYSQKHKSITPQTLLISLIGALIENNDAILTSVEDSLEQLEEKILVAAKKEYSRRIVAKRKLLMKLRRNLEPFTYVTKVLYANTHKFFIEKHVSKLGVLEDRALKSVENVMLLREYATQVREAFEAEREIATNDFMRVFTMVTSIFMPLTLIAGWYGMNFVTMPELTSKYGYIYVIGLSLIVVIGWVWFFKRKKWL